MPGKVRRGSLAGRQCLTGRCSRCLKNNGMEQRGEGDAASRIRMVAGPGLASPGGSRAEPRRRNEAREARECFWRTMPRWIADLRFQISKGTNGTQDKS
jgi:hypothetical protein